MVDYCSLSPEGDWSISGCLPHDIAYGKIKKLRFKADNKLREAVEKGTDGNMKLFDKIIIKLLGRKTVSYIYYYAVRIFGRFDV